MKKHLSLCVTSLMVAALFLAVFTFSRVGGNFIATYKDYAFSFFIGIGLPCLGVYFNSINALLLAGGYGAVAVNVMLYGDNFVLV